MGNVSPTDRWEGTDVNNTHQEQRAKRWAQPHRFVVMAGAVLATGVLLAGCGGGETEEAESSTTNTQSTSTTTRTSSPSTTTTTSTTTEAPKQQAVNPEEFSLDSGYGHGFSYTLGGSPKQCFIADGQALCQGTPPPETPQIRFTPMPAQNANAVTLDASGIDYTAVESMPPAQRSLNEGESLTVDGITCTAGSASTLSCSTGAYEFTISGSEARIAPNVAPKGELFATDTTVKAGESCGTVSNAVKPELNGSEAVALKDGTDCAEAMAIVNEFATSSAKPNLLGKTTETYGPWTCSSPGSDPASALTCHKADGTGVGVARK